MVSPGVIANFNAKSQNRKDAGSSPLRLPCVPGSLRLCVERASPSSQSDRRADEGHGITSLILGPAVVWRSEEKGKSPINEDLLSSSDFFSRSTEAHPDPFDFPAGSRGDRFESSFQTLGCLVLRYGRLFVELFDREDQAKEVALLMSKQRGRAQFSLQNQRRMI